MVAIHVGPAPLLVRASYRIAWCLPGGGLHRNEAPEAAARRELAEEIGPAADALLPRGSTVPFRPGFPWRRFPLPRRP